MLRQYRLLNFIEFQPIKLGASFIKFFVSYVVTVAELSLGTAGAGSVFLVVLVELSDNKNCDKNQYCNNYKICHV